VATGAPSPQQPATPLRHRANAAQMTADQLAHLRNAWTRAADISAQNVGDERGYQYWAGIHGLPLPMWCQNAHGSPYFLPWHRAYLYFFERALRDQDPDAMLAWWDWATEPGEKFRPAAR
jgi:tyrosinase